MTYGVEIDTIKKRPLHTEEALYSSKPVSRVLLNSIIDLVLLLLTGLNNLPILNIPIVIGTGASNSASRTYLVFQLLRFTAITVTRKGRELLPHVFTLTPTSRGGIFSVALAVAGCRRLPVRKQDALCCPDFPPPRRIGAAIERFAVQR